MFTPLVASAARSVCAARRIAFAAAALSALAVAAPARAADRGAFHIDVRIDSEKFERRREPVCEERQVRVWVPAVYRTVHERRWIEPVYRTVCERVWHEPVAQTVCERVWVPARYEEREVHIYRGRSRFVRRESVCVEPAHYEARERRVVVSEGYFENIERSVLACEGHWEDVDRQEVVCEGHYEWRTERVEVRRDDGPF